MSIEILYAPPLLFDCSKNLFLQALKFAIGTYREHKSSWEGLIKRGMERDYSWNNAAEQYEQVFQWAFMDPPYVK